MKNRGFCKGINIGGWLSQYDVNEKKPFTKQERANHFVSFITEADFKQIAAWGADHVRLPVAAWLLENQEPPHEPVECGFHYLDSAIKWCEKYGLNLIIDLHEFRGHIYGQMEKVIPLLADKQLQKRFVNLWENIVTRYKGVRKPVIMYELLNEISDSSGGYLWKKLYEKTLSAIRRIDEQCLVLIGCNNQNSVFDINTLQLVPDANVWYNFHFYEPQVFTHQKAHFSQDMMLYHKTVHYPDEIDGFISFLEANPQYIPKYRWMALEKGNSRELIQRLLAAAENFMKYSGKILYCGEFGVINTVSDEDRIRYLYDVQYLLDSFGIGHAYWNYKEMDFGLVDRQGNIICSQMVDALFRDK